MLILEGRHVGASANRKRERLFVLSALLGGTLLGGILPGRCGLGLLLPSNLELRAFSHLGLA